MSVEISNEFLDKVIAGEVSKEALAEMVELQESLGSFDMAKAASSLVVKEARDPMLFGGGAAKGAAGAAKGAAGSASSFFRANPMAAIAALVGANALAGGAMDTAKTLGSAAVDSMAFKQALRVAVRTRPELGSVDPKVLKLAFRSLWTLSPTIAKDPLLGSQYLLRIVRNVSVTSPSDLATVDAMVLRELEKFSPRGGGAPSMLQSGATTGMAAGMGTLSKGILDGSI